MHVLCGDGGAAGAGVEGWVPGSVLAPAVPGRRARGRAGVGQVQSGQRGATLKELLIAAVSVVMIVGPAFAALNVWTEKNRL